MVPRKKLLLIFGLTVTLVLGLQNVLVVNANFKPIPHPAVHINSNGEITPSDAPIERNGNVYKFTGNWTQYVLEVECSNIVIDGAGFFIIANGVGQGIGLFNVKKVSVLNINVLDTNRGIYLERCSDMIISGCTVTVGNNGIYLNGSTNNKLSDNRLISAYNGVTLDHSGNNLLQNNRIENSHKHGYGLDFLVTGQSNADYTNDVDASNTVNGAPIVYWINHQNEAVPSNAAYVGLINCKGITVQNLHISKTQGILVAWTTNSTIVNNYLDVNQNGIHVLYCLDIKIVKNEIWQNNQLEEGGDGVRLDYSQFITVTGNKLTDNDNGGVTCNNSSKNLIFGNMIGQNNFNGVNLVNHSDFNLVALNFFFNHTTMSRGAVFIEDSKNNRLVANNFTRNGCWAIQLKGMQGDNVIYANNFLNNSYKNTMFTPGALQISTPGTENGNSWDKDGVGNYWSDYTGSDVNGDSVGDTPYYINPNNKDNYPLITLVDPSKMVLDIPDLASDVLLTSEFSVLEFSVIVFAAFVTVIAVGIEVYWKKRKT